MTIEDLQAAHGPIPPANTEARLEWLGTLTEREVTEIAESHGVELTPLDCWGWGATAVGLPEGDNPPRCVDCEKTTRHPLWYYSLDGGVIARCYEHGLTHHLTGCEHWPDA